MKSNTEILNEFGQLLTHEVFDSQYKFILNTVEDLGQTEGYRNLFNGMTEIQKQEIEYYTREILKGSLFDFLRIFEENQQFKLYYEADGHKVNLVEISDMLKAEPIIEGGWIEKYSEEINK